MEFEFDTVKFEIGNWLWPLSMHIYVHVNFWARFMCVHVYLCEYVCVCVCVCVCVSVIK
jgi:hypothetical protein